MHACIVIPTDQNFQEIARILDEGGVVAFPTDTVYGVGARLDRPAALEQIYYAKGRDHSKPLPVLVADRSLAASLASDLPFPAEALMRRFFPGPLTLVLPAAPGLPPAVTGGAGKVGVRCPNHRVARRILQDCGGALAVTSANRSGEPPATTSHEVWRALGNDIDVILDARCGTRAASTVVDLAVWPPRLLRAGPITVERLRAVLPTLECP